MKKIDIHKIPDYDPIDISFEKTNSSFHAHFLGQTFMRGDINDLKTALNEAAENRKTFAWKPVILVKSGSWYWERYSSGVEIEKKFFGTIIVPDQPVKYVLADVHTEMFKDDLDIKNWKPSLNYSDWKGDTSERTLIPYTKERWEALKQIETTMRAMRVKLSRLLQGEDGGAWLDQVSANKNLLLTCASIEEKAEPEEQ